MGKARSWSEKDIRRVVSTSHSLRQVIVGLNLMPAGGNYDQVKKYIKETGLDVSHFKGRAWNKGLKGLGKPRISLEDILKRNSSYQSFKLKKRLFDAGIKQKKCEECGWAKKNKDGYLPLELDHINGDRHDNRLENLRILCPNCHSLKPTHRGRNRNSKTRKIFVK